MLQVREVTIKNFKKIESLTLPLNPINIIVGANGSGKSSVVQAIHLACCVTRQADRVAPSKTSTVGIEELDYLPTEKYHLLGHKGSWGNKTGTSSSSVELKFEEENQRILESKCTLRSARNAGISITGQVPLDLVPLLRSKGSFFSAYIPGISGIPNREEYRSEKVTLKACSYGDSNVVLRNALLLLKNRDVNNIRMIEQWMSEILSPIQINVDHKGNQDLYIKCDIVANEHEKPIELLGTGYLQLIQLFSYILLFNPGIALIDEPDIHLHPDVQERLIPVLAKIAFDRHIKMLITTHSPFIVRGAPSESNVYWLEDGNLASSNRETAEMALGWGAFGKNAILMSEDKHPTLLKKIISQWPELERKIAFFPGNGYANLVTPEQAKELHETLGQKFKIIIHRDRDSLNKEEVELLKGKYEKVGVSLIITQGPDIEAYFCEPAIIATISGLQIEECEKVLEQCIEKEGHNSRQSFEKQRRAHNEELYLQGGSPNNEEVWVELEGSSLKGTKGKSIYKKLKTEIPRSAFSETRILSTSFDGSLASDINLRLKEILDI